MKLKSLMLGAAAAAVMALASPAPAATSTQCVTSALAGGTADALTIPLLPCGLSTNVLVLTLTATNTGSATLQMTGGAALPMVSASGAALNAGDLTAGNTVLLTSTGTKWLVLSQLPQTIGTGTTWNGNTIGTAYGGTGANLSSTGGTSEVLKQETVGGAVTVGQLATTDLSDGADLVGATTTQTLTNKTLGTGSYWAGNDIDNGYLTGNGCMTINSSSTCLGGTYTVNGAAGELPSLTTGAWPAAGYLGELLTANATVTAATDGTAHNVTSVSLSAGNWECSGQFELRGVAGSTVTVASAPAQFALNPTSGSIPAGIAVTYRGVTSIFPASSITTSSGGLAWAGSVGPVFYSVSSTGAMYLLYQASLSGSGQITGSIRCVRLG